jgi:hypothetical protein
MINDNDFSTIIGGENTENVCKTLFWRFSGLGFEPSAINRLVRDVFDLLRNGGSFTIALVNYELSKRNWPVDVVDEQTFELIIYLLETEFDYTVQTHPVH